MWTGILLLCASVETETVCEPYTSWLFAKDETACYEMLGKGAQYAESLGWTVEGYMCHNWYPQKEGEES